MTIVLDREGNVQVLDEIDSSRPFRMNTFADEREAAEAKAEASAAAPAMSSDPYSSAMSGSDSP